MNGTTVRLTGILLRACSQSSLRLACCGLALAATLGGCVVDATGETEEETALPAVHATANQAPAGASQGGGATGAPKPVGKPSIEISGGVGIAGDPLPQASDPDPSPWQPGTPHPNANH